jgi:hypothetical protein
MKVLGWKKATFAGLLSVAVLSSSVGAEDKPKETTQEVHTIDASTPRERQIELALSAAPTQVSSKATVYILGSQGYEKVRDGTTGVSCFIWRSFKETMQVSAAPACFDAEGSRTLMLAAMHREELRAQGKSEAEIKDDIAKGYKDGRFKAAGPGFLYMMSSENYFYDSDAKQWGVVPPHLMFYAANKTAKDLGYEAISSTMVPYLTNLGPEGLMVVMAKKPPEDSSTGDSHEH